MKQKQNSQGPEVELDLKRLFMAVWKKKVLVLIVTVVFTLGGYLYSALCLTPMYKSSFLAYINNRVQTENVSGTSAGDLSASMGLAYVYQEVVLSRSVLTEAAQKCGYNLSFEALSGMVGCEIAEGNPVVTVSVASSDPQVACNLAKAISEVAPSHLSRVVEGTSMRIIDEPIPADSKFWPSNTGNAVTIGLLAFALLSLVLIVLDVVKDKVQNVEELERRYQIPVIGVIPDLELAEKKRGGYYGYRAKGGKQ